MAQNPSKLAAAGNMVAKSASMNSGFPSKTQQKSGQGVNDLRKPDIAPITSVEEFCPDGGHLGGFLDDVQLFNSQNTSKIPENEETDS